MQISRADLDAVKAAINDAEAGRGSLPALARAYEISRNAGAERTMRILRDHIHLLTRGPSRNLLENVYAGIVSGTLVTLVIGRLMLGNRGAAIG